MKVIGKAIISEVYLGRHGLLIGVVGSQENTFHLNYQRTATFVKKKVNQHRNQCRQNRSSILLQIAPTRVIASDLRGITSCYQQMVIENSV